MYVLYVYVWVCVSVCIQHSKHTWKSQTSRIHYNIIILMWKTSLAFLFFARKIKWKHKWRYMRRTDFSTYRSKWRNDRFNSCENWPISRTMGSKLSQWSYIFGSFHTKTSMLWFLNIPSVRSKLPVLSEMIHQWYSQFLGTTIGQRFILMSQSNKFKSFNSWLCYRKKYFFRIQINFWASKFFNRCQSFSSYPKWRVD